MEREFVRTRNLKEGQVLATNLYGEDMKCPTAHCGRC